MLGDCGWHGLCESAFWEAGGGAVGDGGGDFKFYIDDAATLVLDLMRDAIRRHSNGTPRHSEATRGNQRSSEVIRCDEWSSVVIRGPQRPSEALRGPQRRSEVIRGLKRLSDEISGRQWSSAYVCAIRAGRSFTHQPRESARRRPPQRLRLVEQVGEA